MKQKRDVGEEKKEAKYRGIYFMHTLGVERDLLWKKINQFLHRGSKKHMQEMPAP